MEVIRNIATEMTAFLISYFSSDAAIIMKENEDLLATDEDRIKYIEAVERIKNDSSKLETITLSNKREMKLVSE